MHGVSHSFEIMFSKQVRHGRCGNSSVFPDEKSVVALLVATPVIRIMLVIMMQEARFSAHRTHRIWPLSRSANLHLSLFRYAQSVGCKLMEAVPALVLLIAKLIFAVTIK